MHPASSKRGYQGTASSPGPAIPPCWFVAAGADLASACLLLAGERLRPALRYLLQPFTLHNIPTFAEVGMPRKRGSLACRGRGLHPSSPSVALARRTRQAGGRLAADARSPRPSCRRSCRRAPRVPLDSWAAASSELTSARSANRPPTWRVRTKRCRRWRRTTVPPPPRRRSSSTRCALNPIRGCSRWAGAAPGTSVKGPLLYARGSAAQPGSRHGRLCMHLMARALARSCTGSHLLGCPCKRRCMSAPEGFGHILQVLIEHRSGPAGNLANWEELLEQCNGYYSWQLAPGSGLKRVQCRCAGVCFLVAASSASLPGSRLHHHTQPSVNRLPVLHASPPLHTFCRAPTLSADDPRLLSSASLCCTPPRLCFLQGGDVQRGRPAPRPGGRTQRRRAGGSARPGLRAVAGHAGGGGAAGAQVRALNLSVSQNV